MNVSYKFLKEMGLPFLEDDLTHAYIKHEFNSIFRIFGVGLIHEGVFAVRLKALA